MISATHFHAMIIHFPIALLIVGFLSKIIALFSENRLFDKAGFYLLLLGALGTIASYLSGRSAGQGIEEGALGKAMELHEQAATISLWLTIITTTFYLCMVFFKYQKSWTKIIGVILFAIVVGSIARTGYLGGQLVYKHGAGVELALPDFSNPQDAENK